jgi:hypothetical protein
MEPETTQTRAYDDARARDKFGGANLGAACFGWLVAVGMTALLTGILAVLATALDYSGSITQNDVQRAAGSVTLVIALVLLAVLLVAYYAGGYVAGRMSRFDGARQGFGVWLFGLVLTLLVAAAGAIAGDQYNVFAGLKIPHIPVSTSDLTTGGAIALAGIVIGSLLAAIVGGKVGERYHRRVDRAAFVD